MSIGKLKARADELSREALLERGRCQASLRSVLAILRRRVGSPAGLAFSFSLGFIAGALQERKPQRRGRRKTRNRGQLTSTLMGGAARLLIPMLTNALVLASQNPDSAGAAPAGQGGQPSRSSQNSSVDAAADAA